MKTKKRRENNLLSIENEQYRYITYCKRKRWLFKKAIEISRLCNQKVFLAIFDQEKQRLVELNSEPDFNAQVVANLFQCSLRNKIVHERFTNQDIDIFSSIRHKKTNQINRFAN